MSEPRSFANSLPLAATAARDEARVRRLFQDNFQFLGRIVRNLGIHGADIDDILSQAFAVAAQRLRDIDPGSERAFLVQTAVRLCANFRRRCATAHEIVMDEPPEPHDQAPGPEELSDQKRAFALLDALLAAMELELRTVFVLFEIEEMTMAEIAVMLELPPGTVASRLRRAREDFQARLERTRRGAGSAEKERAAGGRR